MQVKIYTSKTELINDQNFEEVILPTKDGEITILNHHAPILGILIKGKIILKRSSNKIIRISLNEGFFNFKDDNLLIIITHTNLTSQDLESIKQKAIQEAKHKIEKEKISEETFKELKESSKF